MLLYSLTSFFISLILFPFVLRFLMRWHRVPTTNLLYVQMIKLTQPYLYRVEKIFGSTNYIDGPSFIIAILLCILSIKLKMIIFGMKINILKLFFATGLMILNKILTIYFLAGLLNAFSSVNTISMNRPFLEVSSHFIKKQLAAISWVLNKIRKDRRLNQYAFLIWLTIVFLMNLSIEHQLYLVA